MRLVVDMRLIIPAQTSAMVSVVVKHSVHSSDERVSLIRKEWVEFTYYPVRKVIGEVFILQKIISFCLPGNYVECFMTGIKSQQQKVLKHVKIISGKIGL